MYRIELAPGEETALRTVDELATGIRNGVITSRARIWHNAGQKWLPIDFHPHYQAALKQLEAEAATTTAAEPAVAEAAAAPPPAAGSDGRRSTLRPFGLVAGGIALILSVRMVASATASDDALAPNNVAAIAAVTPSPSPQPVSATPEPDPERNTAPLPMPAVNTVPVADTIIPALEPPRKHDLGGVVRGPGAAPLASAASPAPMPSEQPPSAEEEEPLPVITPAPVITSLPTLPLPTDTLN